MTRSIRRRAVAAAAALAATVVLLTGCVNVKAEWDALVNDRANTPAPSVVRPALLASDPRVVSVEHLQVNPSGFARDMHIRVAVTGEEPVTTETVLAILTAGASTATTEITGLTLVVESADDSGAPMSLEAAAAGLPEELYSRWDDPQLHVSPASFLDSRRQGGASVTTG